MRDFLREALALVALVILSGCGLALVLHAVASVFKVEIPPDSNRRE